MARAAFVTGWVVFVTRSHRIARTRDKRRQDCIGRRPSVADRSYGRRMRPTTLICSLFATLQLLSGTALAAGGWTWPVRGPVITRYLNGADPYAAGQHRGVDIGAPVGARVVAAASGTVTFAGVVGSSGLTVSERTADGRYDLSYLHLSAATVHRGDALSAGTPLGAVGTSGSRSAGAPHLHFGVREAGTRTAYRDPLDFLAPPPAARAPEPAPAPVPVAEPASPEPAPVGPAAAPFPVAVPGVPEPSPRGLPVPTPAGAVEPHARGATAQAGLPALIAHRRAGIAPQLGAAAGTSPAHGPRAHVPPLPAALRGPSSNHARSASPAARPSAAGSDSGGLDLAWLAACLGLVAAATALGHPDEARRLAERSLAGLTALRRRSRGRAESMWPQPDRR
jgi:hypothetical protein